MRSPAIDFLHPRRVSWLGWGLLALGSGMLAAALWLADRWSAEQAEYDAQVRAHEDAVQQATLAAQRPVVPTLEERRLQHVAAPLRQPWLPTLKLIESTAAPPVFLLALSIDPASGQLRLEGEAPEFEQVLAFAQSLDAEGLMGPARLRSHEQRSDPTGRPVVRFSVETRWSAP